MEQEIIDVPYSDNVSSHQVITIDLHQTTTVPQNGSVQTIVYSQDGTHTMTTLQPNDPINPADIDNPDGTHYNTTITTLDGANLTSEPLVQEEALHEEEAGGADENNTSNGSKATTRFKWTNEKSQVAMNLVKHGCKPKLVSVAVGCSLRTAQKFVETVSPKMEGEAFKTYTIRRRGRKSKDVHQRLEAIKEVLSKDSSKTQVEIAADLKVSNTTVCRDLKRLGNSWREKKNSSESLDNNKRESRREKQSSNKKQLSTTSPNSKSKPKGRQKRPKKENSETSAPAPNIEDGDH